MKARLITTPEVACLATRAIDERCNGQLNGLVSWRYLIPKLGVFV